MPPGTGTCLPVSSDVLAGAGDLGPYLEGISCWRLLPISLSHFSPCSLHTYLLTGGGVPLQALTFSPFLQCLRSFGPLALYSLTPPSTSPSSLPPLDWSRQLSYLPGKDQKTQLRAMGPSPRKHLGMETRQVEGRGHGRSPGLAGRLEGKGPQESRA